MAYDGDKRDKGFNGFLWTPRGRGAQQPHSVGRALISLFNAVVFLVNIWFFFFKPTLNETPNDNNNITIVSPKLAGLREVDPAGSLDSRRNVNVPAPAKAAPSKMLVLSRYKEDTTYIDLYLRDVPHVVYQGGNPAAAHPVIPDAGLESLAYLRYICDNYHNLPDRMAFIHAHRSSRHYDDIVPLLQYLKWDAFPFFNLNVRFMVQKFLKSDIEKAEEEWRRGDHGAMTSPLEDQAWQKKNHVLAQGAYIKDFWRRFLTPYSNVSFPDVIASPCCASFVVSKERVLKHPLKLYQVIADWLVSMELPSHWSARVLEYTWHVLWSDSPVEKQKHICQITEGLCTVDPATGKTKAPLIVAPTAVDMPPTLEAIDDPKEWKRLWREERNRKGWRNFAEGS